MKWIEWAVGLCGAAVLVGACSESMDTAKCPDGTDPIVVGDSSSCIVAVVETGFLCGESVPHRYEVPNSEAVICSDQADLSDSDVTAIVDEHARRNEHAADALSDAGRNDASGANGSQGRR